MAGILVGAIAGRTAHIQTGGRLAAGIPREPLAHLQGGFGQVHVIQLGRMGRHQPGIIVHPLTQVEWLDFLQQARGRGDPREERHITQQDRVFAMRVGIRPGPVHHHVGIKDPEGQVAALQLDPGDFVREETGQPPNA